MIISERPAGISLLRILFLVVFVGWIIVGQGIGLLVGMIMHGENFLYDLNDPLKAPDMKYSILLVQGIGAIVGQIVVSWYYLRISEHRSLAQLFKRENNIVIVSITVFAVTLLLAVAISPIAEWNANFQFPEWMSSFGDWATTMEASAKRVTDALVNNMTPMNFIVSFIVIAVIAAIGEEIVYRGLIQTEFIRLVKNPHVGIWLASALFSAIHFQFFGFLPRLLLGVVLGYLYYWSGNIWISILCHFFNNGVQVIVIYLSQLGIIDYDIESTDSAPLALVAISIILTLGLLYYLRNYFKSQTTAQL